MVLFHADDYGVNPKQAERILDCSRNGCLKSVSIMPNSRYLKKCMEQMDDSLVYAVHINLAEGRCLADRQKLSLLVDKNGFFRQSFVSLLFLSFFQGRNLKQQVQAECTAQIQAVCRYAELGYRLRIDSHVHYHMVPGVFRGLCAACRELGIEVEAVRWPVETLLPVLSDWKAFRQVRLCNLAKNLIFQICAVLNYPAALKMGWKDRRAVFFGILFSGNMNKGIVQRLLPQYEAYAKKRGKNLEVLFHPGFIPEGGELLDDKFAGFYHSENRRVEAYALLNLNSGRRKC